MKIRVINKYKRNEERGGDKNHKLILRRKKDACTNTRAGINISNVLIIISRLEYRFRP